jgi:hypothetical protein
MLSGRIEAAAEAARKAVHMDRHEVRAELERRFTAERWRAYLTAYRSLLNHFAAPWKLMIEPLTPLPRPNSLA